LFPKDEILNEVKPKSDPRLVGLGIRATVMCAISLLFAVSGPFGTYESGNFGARLMYWVVLIGVSMGMAWGLKFMVRRSLGNLSFVTQEGLVILAMTCIFTAFLQIWTLIAFPGIDGIRPGYWLLALEVLVICTVVCTMMYWIPKLIETVEPKPMNVDVPRLATRLPDGFDGQILRLTVNGHKVMVVTSDGSFDVRMRFADAVVETSPLSGFSTHRSHWVNQAAISEVTSHKGRPVIVMTNRDVVPVSRKYQRNVEDAGLM
jgi:hypothetical protein